MNAKFKGKGCHDCIQRQLCGDPNKNKDGYSCNKWEWKYE